LRVVISYLLLLILLLLLLRLFNRSKCVGQFRPVQRLNELVLTLGCLVPRRSGVFS
jgi:hypothetical protein